ncbi:hypothetical protein EJ02DRAFT_452902 [Clathrospora elynae]|uniref:Uncharacterized protein n=1 Tax=Clathrospora elynae TaxID=706981 RepID=A0A6A5T451_9PLEO|nr:hypothetical protein EJ02DRAFT_452902 [Clathrospora elynae]
MRYSIFFSSVVALAAAAPLDLNVLDNSGPISTSNPSSINAAKRGILNDINFLNHGNDPLRMLDNPSATPKRDETVGAPVTLSVPVDPMEDPSTTSKRDVTAGAPVTFGVPVDPMEVLSTTSKRDVTAGAPVTFDLPMVPTDSSTTDASTANVSQSKDVLSELSLPKLKDIIAELTTLLPKPLPADLPKLEAVIVKLTTLASGIAAPVAARR